MKIHSFNEWDPLKEIVVGSAKGAHWPKNDPIFVLEPTRTSWHETPVPSGQVPDHIIEETEEDLQGLVDILEKAGVRVHRPREHDFSTTDGMYNYCPRDRLIVAGDKIIDPTMMYPCRDQEIEFLDFVTEGQEVISMPRGTGLVMDAANISRCGDFWVYLESSSGNRSAVEWLAEQVPDIDIYGCNFYSGVHIDSTIVPLREGLVLLNGSRVNEENVPACFKEWEKIYINEVVAQDFYRYPWASKWIALNILSIDPQTVIVDKKQSTLISMLESRGFTVIPHELRHSRTLGGGFHCVTLDTWRQDA